MTDLAAPTTIESLSSATCRLEDFIALVERSTDLGLYQNASSVDHGVVIYRSGELRDRIGSDPDATRQIRIEIADVLMNGPGIVVLTDALDDAAIDRATVAFEAIIEEEKSGPTTGGDHFAKPGANDRIWNALEKLALRDPQAFADYYRNDIIALTSEAWLGPAYQLTSQVNVVNPGGDAQQPHRDYHLGFMEDDQAARYPSHIHRLSPALTLQGAIAHCDMPIETGPTMYLPHSQRYGPGYLAWRRPEFKSYFAEHHVQLPLRKGDAIFFNPAVFHAAGSNETVDVRRMANLLQVSSAMGRAMESIDRAAMSFALYPILSAELAARPRSADAVHRVIAASAEGYPFPANLDVDQPVSGLAPASQADIVKQALTEGWPVERLRDVLAG